MEDDATIVVEGLMEQLESDKKNLRDEKLDLAKRTTDPMIGLRETVAGYITGRFEALGQETEFIQKIRAKIEEKLPDATFSELMRLLESVKVRETEAVGSLLEFFKPSQGDRPTLIGDVKTQEERSPEERIHGDADAETLRAINKLTQLVATMAQDKEE